MKKIHQAEFSARSKEIIEVMKTRDLHRLDEQYSPLIEDVRRDVDDLVRSQGYVQWRVVKSTALALARMGGSLELCDYFGVAYMKSHGFAYITRVDIMAKDDYSERSFIQLSLTEPQMDAYDFMRDTSIKEKSLEFYLSQNESSFFIDVAAACSGDFIKSTDLISLYQSEGKRFKIANAHSYCAGIIDEFAELRTPPNVDIVDEAKIIEDTANYIVGLVFNEYIPNAINALSSQENRISYQPRR